MYKVVEFKKIFSVAETQMVAHHHNSMVNLKLGTYKKVSEVLFKQASSLLIGTLQPHLGVNRL